MSLHLTFILKVPDFTFSVQSSDISAPPGVDNRDNALSLQLVRPEHGRDDEYYIENVDDGKYLVVEYEANAIDDHWKSEQNLYRLYPQLEPTHEPSLHFVCSPSEATLFRIKEYGPLLNADLDLQIGSVLTYESWSTNYRKAKAEVIDLRESAFGKEVKLKYFTTRFFWKYDPSSRCYKEEVKTDWIPAASPKIGDFSLYAPSPSPPPSPEIAIESKCEKRRRVKKTGKRKKGNRRDSKYDERSGRKRSERKMRKYGRIPKYEV